MADVDVFMRAAAGQRPADMLALVPGLAGARLVEPLDANLPATDRRADFVVLAELPDGRRLLVHIEFQTRYHSTGRWRTLGYRLRVWDRDRDRADDILSVIVHLTPEGHPGAAYNHLTQAPLGRTQLYFEHVDVRLWEIDSAAVLAGGRAGLMPLVPLMAGVTEGTLSEAARIARAVPDDHQRRELLAAMNLLGGLRWSPEVMDRLIRREEIMESSTLKRWREEFRAEGVTEGLSQAHTRSVLRVLRRRFGDVPAGTADRLGRVGSPERLEELVELAATCDGLAAFSASLPA